MTIIDHLIWTMQGESSQLKGDIDKARKNVKTLEKDMVQADSQAGKLTSSVNGLVAALFSVGTAKFLHGIVDEQARLGASINETAQIIGNSSDSVNRFAKATSDAGEDVATGLNMLEQFGRKVAQNEKALNDAGIAARRSNGDYRDTLSIYQDLVDASEKMNAAEKARLFNQLGLDPRKTVGLADGGFFSDDFLKQAARRKQIMDDLARVQGEIRAKLGEIFMPILVKFNEFLKKAADGLNKNLKPLLGVLGAIMGVFAARAAIQFARLLFGIAATTKGTDALRFALLRLPGVAVIAGLGLALGKIWDELEDSAYRDSWLSAMEDALPNLSELIKNLKFYWDEMLKSIGAESSWDAAAYAIGKVAKWLDQLIGSYRKIAEWLGFGEKMVDVGTGGLAHFVPESSVPKDLELVDEFFTMPKIMKPVQIQNQHLTETSRMLAPIIGGGSKGVVINSSPNIDIRPTFNVSGDFDKKVAEKTVNQMREVFRQEMSKQTRDLANQAATGQER